MRSGSDTPKKIALVLGFVGVGAATAIAYRNPVTGYELSIYWGTPGSFWVGSSIALLVSILVVFSTANRRLRMTGAFLGGVTMTSIASLPIVRGYHWMGESDSLSHLGTAREMTAGVRALTESRYPIVHTLGSVLHDATGLALRHVMLIVVVVFVVGFFIFVPLVVKQLEGETGATYIALFSGFLLLPINQLSPSMYIHPTSQAILFAPVFLFVFFLLLDQHRLRYSMMFIPLAAMYVLLHPQQAANLVAFFGAIAVIQIGYDLLKRNRLSRMTEWVIPEVAVYAGFFWLWASKLPAYQRNSEEVFETLSGQTQFAQSTVARSVSLTQVGGSLPEVFVKLFLVSLVYVLLTGALSLVILRRFWRFELGATRNRVAPDGGTGSFVLTAVLGGLVPVTSIFLIYLVGGISDQYYRHLGMLMVFGTVLGAVALGRASKNIGHRWSLPAARNVIVVVLVLFLALSVPVVFASPYIYYSSDHVTEAQLSGYATTFEHQADGVLFDEVRSTVYRYGHAIEGPSVSEEQYYVNESHGVPDHFANRSLRSRYDEQVYLPVTEADRIRDPVLWEGFRFNTEDFDYLDTQPGIDKVQAGGGYDLYLIGPAGPPTNQSTNVSSRAGRLSRPPTASLAK